MAFHSFVILGELGVGYTALRGLTVWTTNAAFLLLLAGLLTLVYPDVGTHPRYARWVWGQPRRSALPWLVLFILLVVSLLHAAF